jgi:membrane glycosyltransferase
MGRAAESRSGGAAAAGAMPARVLGLSVGGLSALSAYLLFLQFGTADGADAFDHVRALLILVATFWLGWGAAQGLLGLTTRPPRPASQPGPITARTVVLVPVYNEDPVSTFARIAAMDASLAAIRTDAVVHFAILSDTRSESLAARERHWFQRLIRERNGAGRIFYRRREHNRGRKAGNIEDFITRSGAAYDHALILDADSLMEGATILEMVRRMEADPDLGLLQSLPRVINARSRFGRTMQFSAAFFSPVFARGLAMMQGRTGPFWGHNAMVRIRAFAASCGLPELSGPPPFGGHVLSHDYVEAALMARAGWKVRLDDDLDGSFEEGPETIVDHARRDRRWCQGNLQHARLLLVPGLKAWSRWVFLQGILSYVAPLFWLAFILTSVAAQVFRSPPDYFPDPNWPFPVFPVDERAKAIGLAVGIFGLLFLPKLLITLDRIASGRARAFGGGARAGLSALAELLVSSLLAPILLMYQTRSVFQVLLGIDGGWPANNRNGGRLTLRQGIEAGGWIALTGLIGLLAVHLLAPDLVPWLLPVAAPLCLAPLLIAWTSGDGRSGLMAVPSELDPAPVIRRHAAILQRWTGEIEPVTEAAPAPARTGDRAATPLHG